MRPKINQVVTAAINLSEAVRRYVNERENPAPDPIMRRIEFDRMKAALEEYEKVAR